MQKRVTWLFFISLAIPFILMRDVYPMFRFGMFAEPVRKETLREKIIIYYGNTESLKEFSAQMIGMNVSVFEQVKRKYFYLQKTPTLLSYLDSLTGFQYPTWRLERIATQNAVTDTIVIELKH